MSISPESAKEPKQYPLWDSLDRQAALLPPVPTVILRLRAEMANEWIDVSHLTRLIRSDPNLAGPVLRLANSPLFRGSREVVAIEDAIQRIGMDQLRSLTFLVGARSVAPERMDRQGISVPVFWHHAVLVATVAVDLGRKSGLERSVLEQLWVAGLLHDIGALLTPLLKPSAWDDLLYACQNFVASEPPAPNFLELSALEKGTLGWTHAQVGAVFLEKHWQLPDPLVKMAYFWNEPTLAPPELAKAIWCLHRADQAAQFSKHCWQPTNTFPTELPDLLETPEAGASAITDNCLQSIRRNMELVDALLQDVQSK